MDKGQRDRAKDRSDRYDELNTKLNRCSEVEFCDIDNVVITATTEIQTKKAAIWKLAE